MMRSKIVLGTLLFSYSMVSVIAADASRPLGDFMNNLPRKKFPADNGIENIGDGLMDYVLSLVYVVAPGFAIGLLSVLVGIIYGLIKLCCCCCCRKKDDDDEEWVSGDGEKKSSHKTYNVMARLIPSAVYLLFICWIFAGAVIGWTNNGKFSGGVTTLSNSVVNVGSEAVELGNTLLSNLQGISDSIPTSLQDIFAQFSGLPGIETQVTTLGNDINSTQTNITQIRDSLLEINLNLTVIKALHAQLETITTQSNGVIGNVANLIDQFSNKLHTVYYDTLQDATEKGDEVQKSVNDIVAQSNDFVDQAKEMVDSLDTYVDQVKGYNKQRDTGLSAVYAVGFVTAAVGVLGWFLKKALPFHVSAGFGFFFCFLFWVSGSVHLLLGLVLGDVCPIVDTVLHSAIPKDGDAAAAINGCLGDVSLFVSLNLTNKFNLSDVFDAGTTFDQFTGFVDTFNFTEIDTYLGSINDLYKYNLTVAVENVTVADLGWSQDYIYTALDGLNNLTRPEHQYTLENYTQAETDLNDFSPTDRRNAINETKYGIDNLIVVNRTVYQQLDTTKAQMIATQHKIDALIHDIDSYSNEFNDLSTEVKDLSTKNVTNVINIIEGMKKRVSDFFTLGDCSFVGRNYRNMVGALCDTMQPADEMLAASQFMIGLGLIAVIVLVEVLAVRIKHPDNSVSNYGGEEKYDYNENADGKSISLSVHQDHKNAPNSN